MAKMKKNKNMYIYWWKIYFKKWSKKAKNKFHLRDYEIKDKMKEMAQEQLNLIEEAKNDRTQNEKQKEYLEWLRDVAESGNLDNEIQ